MGLLDTHTILIADDERPVRMLMRIVLEAAGATVFEAADGVQARRLLETTPGIDAIVSDLSMPNGDGEGFIRGLRCHWATLPVVIVSATASLVDHPLVRDGLVQAALTKPFSPERLVRTIVQLIHERDQTATAV